MSLHQDYESRLQKFYEAVLQPGSIAIDIGAHTGRHTVPMARAVHSSSSSGLIHAFEPLPQCESALFHRLKKEGLPAGIVKHYPYALSDKEGESGFVVAKDRLEESGLRERQYNGPTEKEYIKVRMKRLDDFSLGQASFIKIDCEGAEYWVLLGGAETISSARPVVSFEFGELGYAAYNVNPYEVFDFFSSRAYGLYDICGRHLQREEFVLSSRQQLVWDYVAIPAEQDQAGLQQRLIDGK